MSTLCNSMSTWKLQISRPIGLLSVKTVVGLLTNEYFFFCNFPRPLFGHVGSINTFYHLLMLSLSPAWQAEVPQVSPLRLHERDRDERRRGEARNRRRHTIGPDIPPELQQNSPWTRHRSPSVGRIRQVCSPEICHFYRIHSIPQFQHI